MSIFIGRRPEAAFTRVPNEWARDPKLSTKAKGLLTYLLSHEDGYQLSMKQVIAEVKASPKPIILFIDEAHTIIGAGGSRQAAREIANVLNEGNRQGGVTLSPRVMGAR